MNAIVENSLVAAAADCDKKKVREKGGNNRGPEVREYLRSVGLGEGYAWCAAFVTHHFIKSGLPKAHLPVNPASACNWLHKAPNAHWDTVKDPQRGDVGGWCDSGKWQGHLFRVVKSWRDEKNRLWIETLEGNTGPDGGRDGDGCYRKKRMVTSKFIFVRYTG